MAVTLALELALLSINLLFSNTLLFLLVFAIGNGVYNCFFWTTQRTLFVELISSADSGRQYGNFQIFVMVFLKFGIFAGGFLLENFGYSWVFIASALVVLAALIVLQVQRFETSLPEHPAVPLKKISQYQDTFRSKRIFVVDGLFLFLESHFWTVSLFLLSAQNFARLGLIVIAMAVVFAILFFLAKNTIDKLMGKRVYQGAVLLYAVAWWLRPMAVEHVALEWLAALLLIITFFTSFFRLAFNKRFYDNAKQSQAREYLIIKSYYTQFAVAVIYAGIAAFAVLVGNDILTLKVVYVCAGFLALAYLWYRSNCVILSGEKE